MSELQTHNISRRAFVTAAGAACALGALTATGCASPQRSRDDQTATEETHDIVVIGAGGAGMSAAIAAYDAGVTDVVILEKMGNIGGNTNFSSSGMNASETKFQQQQGIQDSNELFAQETFDGGHDTANRELVDFMCDHSAATIDWLDNMGITLDNIGMTGGMSVRRCHRPTDGSAVGATLVPGLESACNNRGIQIIENCDVTKIDTDDSGAVTGVEATKDDSTPVIYHAKAVIDAAGGLGSNPDMIHEYRPDLDGYISTNQPGATGDGYTMAQDCGAQLIQMDQIQIHPTVEKNSSSLIAEAIRGAGAIMVNENGQRFYDEMSTRDRVSQAELQQPNRDSWLVFDQRIYDANKAIPGYDRRGYVQKGSNVDELASQINLDPTTLRATIDAYNAAANGGTDEFGRTQGLSALDETGNMYAILVTPGIHHEMGGVRINTNNEALNADGNPIPNLYAAGEVTGGIHGNNRIGGNAVCDITTFGRNCGEVVAQAVQS